MANEVNGAAASPTADNGATTIPGRAEATKAIAGQVLKSFDQLTETVVAPKPDELPAAGEKPKNDLSQAVNEGAEPEWNPAQTEWFAKMEAAKTPEEREALQATQPEFSAEQIDWLEHQGETPSAPGEDHLAEDAELKGRLDVRTQERINARIGKEVAKTKAAQEKAEQLEQQVADLTQQLQAKPVAGPSLAAGPLDQVQTSQDLQQVAATAEQALDQADDLMARLESDPGGVEQVLREAKIALKGADGTEDYSPEAMAKYLKLVRQNADRTLRREVPKRMQFLKDVDAYSGEVLTLLPEIKDANSPRNKRFWETVTNAPWLKQMPAWPRMAAIYTLGLERYQEMQQQKSGATAAKPAADTKPKRPIPVKIPTPRGMQPPPTPRTSGQPVDQNTLADSLISGNKNARLRYIETLVPK